MIYSGQQCAYAGMTEIQNGAGQGLRNCGHSRANGNLEIEVSLQDRRLRGDDCDLGWRRMHDKHHETFWLRRVPTVISERRP